MNVRNVAWPTSFAANFRQPSQVGPTRNIILGDGLAEGQRIRTNSWDVTCCFQHTWLTVYRKLRTVDFDYLKVLWSDRTVGKFPSFINAVLRENEVVFSGWPTKTSELPKVSHCCMLSRLSGKRYHGVGWPLWISEKALPKDNSRIFLFIFLVIYIIITTTIFYFHFPLFYKEKVFSWMEWIMDVDSNFFTFSEWKWNWNSGLSQTGNFLELLVNSIWVPCFYLSFAPLVF